MSETSLYLELKRIYFQLMEVLINKLKVEVVKAAENPNFIHHRWYVKYHLEILENITMELCDKHEDADRDLVKTLVWIHDYGKILGIKEDMEKIVQECKKLMKTLGFDDGFTEKTLEYLQIFESKLETDLRDSPIEVKIVSSADGASHMIGPFYSLWWYENTDKEIEELMEGNRNKAKKDWERKIVLPEVKEAFKDRNRFVLESSGILPERYFL